MQTVFPALRSSAADQKSARRKIRICHVSMTLRTGGLERLLVDFGRVHEAAQFELCFVALEELGPPADDLRKMGFCVYAIPIDRVGKWRTLTNLRDLLRREQIDLVHTHNTYAHFYGTLAARWAHVPAVINTQHGRGCGSKWKERMQFSIANRLTRRVIGVSENSAQLCRQQDPLSWRKTSCIWNGIDLSRFSYQGPASEPTAIAVARLSPEKDIANLLRAVPTVLAAVPDFRLKIVGGGSERGALDALTAQLQIGSAVEFLGECRDIPERLRTAGFFVSSSKTEGISLTLLEAMAVGLPIVATRVGGTPEIVTEGVTGRLVPPQDSTALAQGIIQMCQNRAQWFDMGVAARARVEKDFDVRRMVANYETLYRQEVGAG